MADRNDEGVIASLPDLQIEHAGPPHLVVLQQTDYSGNTASITVHRWQVLLLAQHFALIPPPVDSKRDVAAILARRLLKFFERVDELGEYVNQHVDDEFAKQNILATCEIGDEFIADLPELLGRPLPTPAASDGRTRLAERKQEGS